MNKIYFKKYLKYKYKYYFLKNKLGGAMLFHQSNEGLKEKALEKTKKFKEDYEYHYSIFEKIIEFLKENEFDFVKTYHYFQDMANFHIENIKNNLYNQDNIEEIDKEIEELVQWAYERAVEILKKNESPFVYLTQLLKDKRDLYVDDFRKRNISF